jgi:3-hydroxybutyryl-CoA dehydrogenase
MVRAQRVFDASGLFVVRSPAVPGFLVDRLFLAALAEACKLIAAGLADIESVDRTFRLHTFNNLGLLQVADLMGLDAVVALYESLASGTGQSQYAPPRLLRAYVEQGFLGRKSGRGFYQYGSFGA